MCLCIYVAVLFFQTSEKKSLIEQIVIYSYIVFTLSTESYHVFAEHTKAMNIDSKTTKNKTHKYTINIECNQSRSIELRNKNASIASR